MNVAYQKFSGVFLFVILIIAAMPLSAATEGYIGINTSLSQWQMGLASGKTVQLFGINQQTNKPDPLLYMAGISASVVYNKTWALTYQGEVGTAKPQITLTGQDTSLSPTADITLAADTSIVRTDHSFAVSRSLGTTGFSLFAGAKIQWFGYKQDDGKFTQSQDGVVTLSVPFSIGQNILNFGPAAGVTYTFCLYGKIFGALQAGFIYFPGQYRASMSAQITPTQKVENEVDEKFYGIGATGLVSVIIPLGERVLLQLAGRGQYYSARTLEGSVTLQTKTKTTTTPSATMDNATDLMLGGQLAVICKVF